MKTLALTALSIGAAFAAFSYSSTAHALGPIDIEIAARVGYATNPNSTDFVANPYGFGFGGRAGVSFFGIYGGISGMYYLGSSGAVQFNGTPGAGGDSVSWRTAMEGFELGYTLPIPFVKIRPQVGLGNATAVESSSLGGQSGSFSSSNLYLEPGVLVFFPIGILIVGADVNALILPTVDQGATANGQSKAYASLSFHGQVGVRF
jgi:hypothetical protein